MKSPILKSACFAIFAAAFVASAPARAELGADDLKGSAMPATALPERVIVVGQGTRWINVDYGETIALVVNGPGGMRQLLWRFDGLANKVDLSDIDREARLSIPVYVNQTLNPLTENGGE